MWILLALKPLNILELVNVIIEVWNTLRIVHHA